jgi:hypothetical protein
MVRDRPFNLKGGGYGFLFRSEFFFRTTQELEIIFFCREKWLINNHSTISLKQHFGDRHFVPLEHIILIPRQPVFALAF